MPENLRLYLDQMFQTHVALVLRSKGYDVIRASEVGQSRADDRQILKKAITDDRILVTLDEHFGDWVALPLHKHAGVIRVKANPTKFWKFFYLYCSGYLMMISGTISLFFLRIVKNGCVRNSGGIIRIKLTKGAG